MSDDPQSELITKAAKEATKQLVDKGMLVEAGWVGFVLACKLSDAPQVQLTEMRRAFFGGAMHLFSSILSFLESGSDATDKDLASMDALDAELKRFQKELEAHMASRN